MILFVVKYRLMTLTVDNSKALEKPVTSFR